MRIKAELFPYGSEDVPKYLRSLSEGGFIWCYEVDSSAYIQIVNFTKHQHPHKQEQPSTIPKCSEQHRNNIGSPPADSLIPLTDSLYLPHFNDMWEKYPKKKGKDKAKSYFLATVKNDVDLESFHIAITNYLRSRRVVDGYILDGERFFKTWKEWVEYTEDASKQTPKTSFDTLREKLKLAENTNG